ncbi:hypothetical protein AJ80_08593 [Polytolypa hystricis UAMH7299]|uniref:Zn(2)-C6 fungal-type domain-containing protein n=1 Tax=Polytolypa hystricis (strain UAMH7299) TaxID=1447883 RepID=A0A2B7X543_POLH7|nr:hypothetical protein AJ80_08593 [Polytolypa hystricis UAMH7299]
MGFGNCYEPTCYPDIIFSQSPGVEIGGHHVIPSHHPAISSTLHAGLPPLPSVQRPGLAAKTAPSVANLAANGGRRRSGSVAGVGVVNNASSGVGGGATASSPTALSSTEQGSPIASPVRTSAKAAAAVAAAAATAPPTTVAAANGGRRRNVSILAGMESSPGSTDGGVEETEHLDDKRKQPVKRACNECRQQKLRCDVVQEPYTVCTRCRRLRLDCKIESNFKRVGKRSRNAEMEREIIELRKQIANANAAVAAAANAHQHHALQMHPPGTPATGQDSPSISTPFNSTHRTLYQTPGSMSNEYMGSHEAVASLLDLRSGLDSSNLMRSPSGPLVISKRIEDVSVPPERVTELFSCFFAFYHPFLPFLDRDKPPEDYYSTSPLLFWTIISVGSRRYQTDPNLLNSLSGPVLRLVWSTLADVPQSYHVVKALALLCTWPFPTSSTSTDPTFMLCGMMMQVAMQIGLHRPSHAQDFSKFRVELRDDELKDRVSTWAICNIVAQRVATGYGQPSLTLFDWTLSSSESVDASFTLPTEIKSRLAIEKFCDKVSKSLYNNRRDPVGLSGDHERYIMMRILAQDFEDLESQLVEEHSVPAITNIYLRAAGLHLRLSAFFDNPTAKDYRQGLMALYVTTTEFLESALNLETSVGPVLTYSSNYIYQMVLAAGFTLLKLYKSFFSDSIDLDYTKVLFNKTIWALRSMSVASNDLPERLAEVLAQMWRMGGALDQKYQTGQPEMDDTLQLKVRCRMSMSLVYDSVWRWREDFQSRGTNFESYLKNPTNPDSNADSSANSSVGPLRTSSSTPGVMGSDPSLAPPPPPPTTGIGGINTSTSTTSVGLPSGFMEPTYEVFDPLNWMLDGLVDFPYSYTAVHGLEAQGIA